MSFFKNIAKSVGISAKEAKDSVFGDDEGDVQATFETIKESDFIELGATDVFELSGKSFEVNEVREFKSDDFSSIRKEYMSNNLGFDLQITSDSTSHHNVIISKKESTGDVVSILKETDIGDLIDSEPSENAIIKAKKKKHNNEWYGKKYRKAHFDKEVLNGVEVDYHLLFDDDGIHALQLYVFEDRTEVYVGFVYTKETLITDIFAS